MPASEPYLVTPRILYVRNEGRSELSREEQRRVEIAGGASRRVLVEDEFGFDLLGESDIRALRGLRGAMLGRLPVFVSLALEAGRRSRDYDVIVTWSERYAVGVAGMLFLRRNRPAHIAILDWVSKPAVRIPLRLVRRGIDRMLTWSSVQAGYAMEHLRFRQEEIVLIDHPVDHEFFSPKEVDRRLIFSAGETQRDYPTLIEAVREIGVPTLIAARRVGVLAGLRTSFMDVREQVMLPEHVRVHEMTPRQLRDAYAAASVVVVPLVPADNNAGISVVLEAMAMGRPVVVSRTIGQVDVVEDGVTGIYVPPGDPDALQDAILGLLADPDRAESMGRRAREYVLVHNRCDDFAIAVRDAARAMAEARPSTKRRQGPPRPSR